MVDQLRAGSYQAVDLWSATWSTRSARGFLKFWAAHQEVDHEPVGPDATSPMVFTAPEDAKAKIPHKMGLPCLGCGVMTAAEWRGPGGRYGSCCRKAADEARAALRGGKQESVVAELTERVEKAEAVIEQQRTQLSEQADAIAGLQRQLAQLSQQVLQRPRETAHTGNAAPARKRPALADQSNAPPAPPAMRLNKAPLVPRAPVMPAAVAPPAPAAAPPPAAAGPKLIDGWKTRQSTSRGCQVRPRARGVCAVVLYICSPLSRHRRISLRRCGNTGSSNSRSRLREMRRRSSSWSRSSRSGSGSTQSMRSLPSPTRERDGCTWWDSR